MLQKRFTQNLSTCAFLNKKLIYFNIILKLNTIYRRTHRTKIKIPCNYGNMVKLCFYLELALQSWTKLLRQNSKSIFHGEKPSPTKSMMFPKLWAFDNQTLPDLTLLKRSKGQDLACKNLKHFLNLLDFEILSQHVLSRIVV